MARKVITYSLCILAAVVLFYAIAHAPSATAPESSTPVIQSPACYLNDAGQCVTYHAPNHSAAWVLRRMAAVEPVQEVKEAEYEAANDLDNGWCEGQYDPGKGSNFGSCVPRDYSGNVEAPGSSGSAPGPSSQ